MPYNPSPPREVYVMLQLLRKRRGIAGMLEDVVVATKTNDVIRKWEAYGIFRGIYKMTEDMDALFLESIKCSKLEIRSFVPSCDIDWPLLIATATKAKRLRERLIVLIKESPRQKIYGQAM